MSKPSWIGATLKGRYKIDSLLGQGGMSAVYRASDPNLKRVVALKLIHAHLSGDPQFVSRFETEAAAVAQLRHPNIVQVYDFDHDEDTYYMVLEFIAGESLNDRLKRITQSGRQLSVPESLHILSQVCDALDYAHKRGLVHRDIKPANIMLDVQGQAILMDFGIVKILGGETHTATGATLGTALYMSPEQVKGVVADHRADIYSLGVTLFEMLSGKPPFQADSVMTVMMMHMTDPVPNLRELRSDVPSEVVAVIEKAMAKDPQGRYQSAAEMAVAMRGLLARYETGTVADQPAAAQPTSDQTYVEEPGAPAPEPPAPVRDEGTLVDSAPASRPIPLPVFKSTPASQEPASQRPGQSDTGPMQPVGASSASQSAASQPGSFQPATVAGSVSESQPSVQRPTGTGPAKKTNALPWVLIAGGGIGALAVLAVIVVLVISLINRNGGGGDQDQNLAAIATQTAVAALLLEETPEPSPTATEDPSTATVTPTVTRTATPTTQPSPTLSPTPSLTPTQTVPPGILYVRINGITIDAQNRYVVEYETFEYTEQLPGLHVHFYFDTVPHDQAGSPGRGPWELYGGPRPFTKYSVNDKPAAAEKMCALVANPNHSVQSGSGMCFDLPVEP